MKRYFISFLLLHFMIGSICCASINDQAMQELPNSEIVLSAQDKTLLTENPDINFVYIPENLKAAIKKLKSSYADLDELVDISLFIDDQLHVAPKEMLTSIMQQLQTALVAADMKKSDSSLALIQDYVHQLESNNLQSGLPDVTDSQDGDEPHVRKPHSKTYSNLIVINSTTTSYLEVTNNAFIRGDLIVSGTIYGNLDSLNIIDHAVQIGTGTASLRSIPVGSNGQVVIGATDADPAFASLTSTGGSLVFTPGPNSLNIETSAAIAHSFPTDSGTATPAADMLTIAGGSNISTGGSGSTVTINLDNNPSVTGSITAGAGLIATTGGINATGTSSISGGTITLNPATGDALNISNDTATSSINIGTGAGAKTVTLGSTTGTSQTTLQAGSDGIVITGAGQGAQVTNSSGILSTALCSTNGQVLIGSASSAPAFGLMTSAAFGNTIRVDAVNGNNATATRTNGIPYANITNALAVANSGDTVWVYPGTYTEGNMNIPNGVSVIGLSQGAGESASLGGSPVGGVIVNYTATSSVYVFNMTDNTRLENITINVSTTTDGLTFGAIKVNPTAISSVRISRMYINVLNTVTNSALTQNAYGVYVNSATATDPEVQLIRGGSIYVSIANAPTSTSTAATAAGIYVNGGGINAMTCNINVNNGGTSSDTACYAYGIYVGSGALTCEVNSSTLYASCGNTANQADAYCGIAATYSLLLENTALQNAGLTAVAASQVTTTPSSLEVWSISGTLSATLPIYMLPGTGSAASSYTQASTLLTLTRPATIKNLRVTAGTAPSPNLTFTIYHNGIATALTATLSSSSASDTTDVVNCNVGDTINMVISGSGSATGANVVASVEVY